jgi:hypothetical protein
MGTYIETRTVFYISCDQCGDSIGPRYDLASIRSWAESLDWQYVEKDREWLCSDCIIVGEHGGLAAEQRPSREPA